ncbi:transposase [Bradyrhizobium japonicum]
MIAAGADLKIYIATRPIDFRCGHDGLAAKVQEMLRLDPFSGAAFVFRSKRADRIKILVWDRTGLVLVHKRLEGCKFVWPTIADGVMRISPGRSRSVPDQGSHRNRGCLPAHLPRVERIIEPASTLCPCGCGASALSCAASRMPCAISTSSNASAGGHPRRIATRKVRREVREAAVRSVSLTDVLEIAHEHRRAARRK